MDMIAPSTGPTITWRQPVVGWNDWNQLQVPEIGTWAPELRVAVIIPARGNQAELDLTLASLAEQTYPPKLLSVLVVDDASHPALELPESRPADADILRLEAGPAFGAGRARRAGAAAVEADVLLFADADIVLDRHHIEAHARWHHTIDYAVTMGYRRFVDFHGLVHHEVDRALQEGRMEELLADRPSMGHTWVERMIERSEGLTLPGTDPFQVAVGANLGVRREQYEAAGGYAVFGRRGLEDIETGFRLQMSGALFVPEPAARSWHQGPRSMEGSRGTLIKRQRHWLLQHYLPFERYRGQARGRQFTVPRLRVIVDAGERDAEAVTATVDSVLASDFTDLQVCLHADPGHQDRQLLVDAYAGEGRVVLTSKEPSPFPSPYGLHMPAGYRLTHSAVGSLMRELARRRVGALRLVPSGTPLEAAALPVLSRTDARARIRAVGVLSGDEEAALGALYGEWWVDATQFGVTDLEHSPTPGPESTSEKAREAFAIDKLQEMERQLRAVEDENARLRRRRALRWADMLGRARRRIMRAARS